MKCTHISTVFASLALVTCLSMPALAVIVDNNTAGYSETGSWFNSDPAHPRTVNDSYRASVTFGDTATYAPALNGQYFVQVHYGAHPNHSANVNYTVNHALGTNVYLVNQQQSAAKGAANTFPITSDPVEGSGWYSLGGNGTLFTLNGSSSVTVAYASPGAALTTDAVRFSNSFVADERAAVINGSWSSIPTLQASGGEESTQYLSSANINAGAVYTPGVNGYFSLAASWGVNGSNTTSAGYLVDIDGNLGTTGDQTTFYVDQRELADQATFGLEGDWSGYHNLFSTMLNTNSTITLFNNTASGSLSADGLQLTLAEAPLPAPEPSSLMLLGLGAIGLSMKARRRTAA